MSQIDVFEQRTIAAINDKTAFASIPPVAVGDKLIQLAELVRRYTVTDYDNSAYDNSGYPVESLVVYGNILYQSLVDSNKIIPGTDITKWQVILDASGSSIDVSQFVKITTDQTVAGIKTFSSSPLVPVATQAAQAVQFSQLQTLIDDIPDYVPPTSTTTTTTTTLANTFLSINNISSTNLNYSSNHNNGNIIAGFGTFLNIYIDENLIVTAISAGSYDIYFGTNYLNTVVVNAGETLLTIDYAYAQEYGSLNIENTPSTTTTTTTSYGGPPGGQQSFVVQNQTDGPVNVNGSQVSAGGSLTIPNN